MPDKNAVLIMENTDTTPRLKIEYIETGSIPEELNGESGFHVYHVRMLTQLMLIQLQKESEDYKLSEKEIENSSGGLDLGGIVGSLFGGGDDKDSGGGLDLGGILSGLFKK